MEYKNLHLLLLAATVCNIHFLSLSSYIFSLALFASSNKCWPRDIHLVDRNGTIFIKAIRLTMSLSALKWLPEDISSLGYTFKSVQQVGKKYINSVGTMVGREKAKKKHNRTYKNLSINAI